MTDFKACDARKLIAHDPWLEPYAQRLHERCAHFHNVINRLDSSGGILGEVSRGHHYFGFNRGDLWGKPGVWYREWAPQALQLRVIGDFNKWDRLANPMVRDAFGIWSLFFPDSEFAGKLVHGSGVKVHVVAEHSSMDRLPAYIRRVVQDPASRQFVGQYWQPPQPFPWHHPAPGPLDAGLRIYEAHIGMAVEEERIGALS